MARGVTEGSATQKIRQRFLAGDAMDKDAGTEMGAGPTLVGQVMVAMRREGYVFDRVSERTVPDKSGRPHAVGTYALRSSKPDPDLAAPVAKPKARSACRFCGKEMAAANMPRHINERHPREDAEEGPTVTRRSKHYGQTKCQVCGQKIATNNITRHVRKHMDQLNAMLPEEAATALERPSGPPPPPPLPPLGAELTVIALALMNGNRAVIGLRNGKQSWTCEVTGHTS